MALFGLGIIVASVFRPTLGVLFTEYFSWRMVFHVNVPMAAFVLLLLLGELPTSEPESVWTDWMGLVLLGLLSVRCSSCWIKGRCAIGSIRG